MMIKKENITEAIPPLSKEEHIQALATGNRVTIERIVSKGHRSPNDFWYDQARNEWVLVVQGRARLLFEEGMQDIELKTGDHLLIPSGKKHRVTWTDPETETIWLVVFFD